MTDEDNYKEMREYLKNYHENRKKEFDKFPEPLRTQFRESYDRTVNERIREHNLELKKARERFLAQGLTKE